MWKDLNNSWLISISCVFPLSWVVPEPFYGHECFSTKLWFCLYEEARSLLEQPSLSL